FPEKKLNEFTRWLLNIYGKFEISTIDFEQLYELMTHDKKNEAGRINFTLLSETGKIEINQNCEKEMILKALEYYRKL
ncbi:MAG: 3-dehydroquinate synthase, partial [Prolixibacteraceae bacterium]|nr:3-dehydroquinate synthase [Prolixibacteraceae bacterium]